MKRTVRGLFTVVVAVSLLVLGTMLKRSVPALHAQGGCALSTLTGNYGFTSTSFVALNPTNSHSPFVPEADVGLASFDGAGNLSVTFTDVFNGLVTQGNSETGTYTVTSGCTGSITLSGVVTNQMVIVSGGTEIFVIETDASGETRTLDLKKQ